MFDRNNNLTYKNLKSKLVLHFNLFENVIFMLIFLPIFLLIYFSIGFSLLELSGHLKIRSVLLLLLLFFGLLAPSQVSATSYYNNVPF